MQNYRELVKKDCERLLTRFQATESVRYQHFLEIWSDMKFSSIFFGKQLQTEKKYFASLVLSVASPYFYPPYTFQIRVGALYLLYGLFNSQLAFPKEKIRIALKEWQNVMLFEKDAIKAQHYDVAYVFRKLLKAKAFSFTAMPNPLSFRLKRGDERRRNMVAEFVEPPSRPQELVTKEMVEEITNIHSHYEDLKKTILSEPNPNLDLVQQNLVPKMNVAVMTYSSWQRNHSNFEKEDTGEGPSNQESSSRAQLLASIKAKSYGQVVEASKSRRHRQTELIPSTEAGTTQGHKKTQVPSLKRRTELLLGTQEIESPNFTQMWCLSSVKEIKPSRKSKRFDWKLKMHQDSTDD